MATERNTPPDPQNTRFERPPKKSLTVWVLLLPLALLIGVLWQSWRQPEQPAQPVMDNAVTPKKKPQTGSTPAPPAANAETLPDKLTIFVPDDNAMLQRQVIDNPVSEYSGPAQTRYEKIADISLAALAKKAPDLFPQGSFIGPVQRDGDIVKVNLKKSWYEMPQWTQGSSFSMLAQDAIVNTLAAADEKTPGSIKVQFLQDGKPAELLGELDMREPLSPNLDTVAKS